MQRFSDNALPMAVSVGGHLLIVVLLLFGLRSTGGAQPIATNIIEGTMVGSLDAPPAVVEVPPEPEVDEPLPVEPPEPEPEPDREAEAAAQRLEEERQAEAERIAEQQRIAEQRRAAEEAQRLEAERQAEQERLAEEARLAEERRQAEAERVAEQKRKEEAARRAEEERRQAEERERKAAADRARAAQEARRQAEAEEALQAQLAEEEARYSAVDAGLQFAYITKIKQKIQRSWSPPAVTGNPKCEVLVRQLRDGTVANIERVDCGGAEPLERSLRAAINRASPLPLPDEASLFDPNLRIVFDPEDD